MDWLLNLIPGGGLGALIGAALAILAGIGTIMFRSERAGVNKQKAKEAEAREKNLQKIKAAVDASGRVRPDDGLHNDPYNRDN
jgi:hypothetical protein